MAGGAISLLGLIFVYPILFVISIILSAFALWLFLQLFKAFGLPELLGEIISRVVSTVKARTNTN